MLAASLFTKNWVYFEFEQGTEDQEFDGSLFSFDKIDSVDNFGYDCKSVPACDADDDSFACKTYDALMKGGIVYLQLEILNWGVLVCWMYTVIHLAVFQRDVGHPIMNYVYAHIGWLAHLFAILMWIVLTRAKFASKDECENDEFDSEEILDVCATVGPYVALGQFILQALVGFYFTFIYYKRRDGLVTMVSATESIEKSAEKSIEKEKA
jgi:hypothetical protein